MNEYLKQTFFTDDWIEMIKMKAINKSKETVNEHYYTNRSKWGFEDYCLEQIAIDFKKKFTWTRIKCQDCKTSMKAYDIRDPDSYEQQIKCGNYSVQTLLCHSCVFLFYVFCFENLHLNFFFPTVFIYLFIFFSFFVLRFFAVATFSNSFKKQMKI